jgi:predicted amidohydrolase
MKISIVQYTPTFGDKEDNFRRLRALGDAIDADLIIFPELCTTGYFFQSKEETLALAEEIGGETTRFFADIAARRGAMVIAGFIEKSVEFSLPKSDAARVYNAALIVQPDAEPLSYRKTHLFYKERFCFDDGNTGFFVTPHYRLDAKIGTMICYDWRFPESARALALKGADIIACPSNLITNVWHIAMPARALENKVFVATPNRAGEETRTLESGESESVRFTGRSALYGYNGETLAQAAESGDEVLTVEINPEATRDKSFNPLNDIFRDRRPALYAL